MKGIFQLLWIQVIFLFAWAGLLKKKNLKKAEAIVGFSYGYVNGPDGKVLPGDSNIAMGRIIKRICRENPNIRIIVAQHEIYDSIAAWLQEKAKDHRRSIQSLRIATHREAGKYLDTPEVAKQAAAFLELMSVDTAVVLSYPILHGPKCVVDSEANGIMPVVVYAGKIPSDKKSAQSWTRGPWQALWYTIGQMLWGRRGE